jgi:hypothetical protein
MSLRRLPLALFTLAAVVLVAPSVASADPVPSIAQSWPACGVAPDTDGRYCIVSQTQNDIPIVRPASGSYEEPYIDLIGAGDVRFGVLETNVTSGMSLGNVPPGDVYRLVVNTGAIRPRELFGNVRNVSLTTGGSAGLGYTFTLTFQPTPIAWWFFGGSCVVGACGDSSTVADLLYDGFVTGYVTDLQSSGLSDAEIALRTGFIHAYNAQDATTPLYDFDTNSLVVQMANPHFRSAGVPATGTYQTFIPNAMLTGYMNVPDPASLTGGSLTVSRSVGSSTAPVPFTLTHTAAGVQIDITGITFSSPKVRIKPKRTAPGKVRVRSVHRATRTSVRLRFRPPLANGGAKVTRYIARCRKAGGAIVTASGDRADRGAGGARARDVLGPRGEPDRQGSVLRVAHRLSTIPAWSSSTPATGSRTSTGRSRSTRRSASRSGAACRSARRQ